MRYLVMVSHGTLAPGLHSVLKMLGNDAPNILSTSLVDDMGADEYVENVKAMLAPVNADDEVVLLGDILGGSPLTNAMNTLAEKGLLAHTIAFGGMNLPMAMTAMMGLATMDLDSLKQVISKPTDFLTFFFGFTLSAVMGCNLIAAAGIGCFFALINYEIASLKIDLANAPKAAIASGSDDEEEEDI